MNLSVSNSPNNGRAINVILQHGSFFSVCRLLFPCPATGGRQLCLHWELIQSPYGNMSTGDVQGLREATNTEDQDW